LANKQHRRSPDFSIISDPFAREEEWLPLIGNGDWIGLNDSKKPSSSPFSNKRSALLILASLILCGLIVPQSWSVIFQAHRERPGVVQAGLAGEDSHGLDVVPRPAFLKGVLPKVVRSLAIKNVDESLGRYKLVSWAEDFADNHIGLVEVKAGKSKMVWQLEQDGLYCPQIEVMTGCKRNGHQVYLVLRQEGAAWQWVQPVCVEGSVVHMLPTFDEEIFEIRAFPDHTHRLIGYHREYLPWQYEKPTIYEWTGSSFEFDKHPHRQLYEWLCQQRKDDPNFDQFDPADAELVDAEQLAEAGYKKLSLRILNRIHHELATGQSIDAMQRCARLMDALGRKRDSTQMALAARKAIFARISHGDKSDYAQPETALDCAALLAQEGRKREALSLLKAIGQQLKDSHNQALKRDYRRLLAHLWTKHAGGKVVRS
jgi:hypothetical protein